jgi:hypothetical protein
VTRSSFNTEFIRLPTALEHVEAREGALAKRLLVQALAAGLPARGYVIYRWPPFSEGYEQLDRELFTDYPSEQCGPARINWAEGSAEMGELHPAHPPCSVLNITIQKAALLSRWPGPLKSAVRSRRPSIARLVKQAEASGHPVVGITTADGTTLTFGQPEPATAGNTWDDILDVEDTKRPA